MDEIRSLRRKTLTAICFVSAIALALVLAEKTEVVAVGPPFVIGLFAVEYAGARPAIGEAALRREIEALRARLPEPPL